MARELPPGIELFFAAAVPVLAAACSTTVRQFDGTTGTGGATATSTSTGGHGGVPTGTTTTTTGTGGCDTTAVTSCGACGHDCAALPHVVGPTCQAGTCAFSCAQGFAHCTASPDDGCETDVTALTDCGACGKACSAGAHATATCTGGMCGQVCDAGYASCNGACVDEQTDSNNCGGCGTVCSGGKSCESGACAPITMAWVDPQTGSCTGTDYLQIQPIAAAMPAAPTTVTITAKQANAVPGYGSWTATFPNQTCIKQWLTQWGTASFGGTWSGVCQAIDTTNTSYNFVLTGGAGNNQVVIYPTGVAAAQYMKVYMLDRPGAWCDLVGVDNRPGNDPQITNSAMYGTQGDSVSFSW